jgi:uncharacterized protein YbjT (DUF2867 family)
MNYAITGSTGHISLPVIKQLVAAGHSVKVITSNANRAHEIEALGATAAVGPVQNAEFLKQAFAGADAVYTMVPPMWQPVNWKAEIGAVGKNYAEAIKANQVKWVVNLSSIGAHLPDGCGPVSGLYLVEQALNELTNTNVLHVRPGYFFNNLLANIGLIRQTGILGSNNGPDTRYILSDTNDIAKVIGEALLHTDFKGHSVKYTSSDERTAKEIATVIGAAIGKPELLWVEFTDEQSLAGMLGAGLSQEIAANYTQMGAALRQGKMQEDYIARQVQPTGAVKLEDFANTFAVAYNNPA